MAFAVSLKTAIQRGDVAELQNLLDENIEAVIHQKFEVEA